MNLKTIKNYFFNLIYPKDIKCVICDSELSHKNHYAICDACLLSLPKNNGKTCLKCGEPINSLSKYCLGCKKELPAFNKSFSPLLYVYPVTKLIQEFKYDNKQYLSETLGNFLVECYIENNLNCNIVIPVPLHEKRLKQRGYNQALLLAKQLNEKLKLNVDDTVLKRIKHTKTQTSLNKEQRKQNVEDAFMVEDKSKIKGATILLIDDVYTTGSTLNECSKILFKKGAAKVYCLTLAHTFKDKI